MKIERKVQRFPISPSAPTPAQLPNIPTREVHLLPLMNLGWTHQNYPESIVYVMVTLGNALSIDLDKYIITYYYHTK